MEILRLVDPFLFLYMDVQVICETQLLFVLENTLVDSDHEKTSNQEN